MDNTSILLNLVESVLGKGKSTSKGNYSFKCPFCNHHKPKLEVNLITNDKKENPWHCWVCNAKGKKLNTLFKKVGVNSFKLTELNTLLVPNFNIEFIDEKLVLPKEFIPLFPINDDKFNLIVAKHALKFLKSRGVTKEDIIKHHIGFCPSGPYINRIIIPSYDEKNNLNYFIARSFDSEETLKYKNPRVNRNIIGFEQFINWNTPVILCEGAFDAISIKRNAIPLFGKTISETLMKKLVTSQVEKVYIALDKDALNDALKHAKTMMDYGKKVYLVELNDKDPNQLGFENFTNIIQNTYPLTFGKLFELKLEI